MKLLFWSFFYAINKITIPITVYRKELIFIWFKFGILILKLKI
jgi:hypothetical protein